MTDRSDAKLVQRLLKEYHKYGIGQTPLLAGKIFFIILH
jgi:hypothetical protein